MVPVPPEPTGISPRVGCVFRALLGDPARTDVLLDFLNAVLQREVPLVAVEILNPAHLPDFIGDDHTVVDVKATDEAGETFQVEMQSWNHAALKERMLSTRGPTSTRDSSWLGAAMKRSGQWSPSGFSTRTRCAARATSSTGSPSATRSGASA